MAFDDTFSSELEREGSAQNNQRNNYGNQKPYNPNNKFNNRFNKKPEEPFDAEKFRLYRPYYMTGNKDTPSHILDTMKRLAKRLESFDYTLRLGGLEGPDSQIAPAVQKMELYLPWKDFNEKVSKFTFNTPEALHVAKMFHPAFDSLPRIHAFLGMNARIVLGQKLISPIRFLVCWSEDGVEDAKNKTAKTGNIGHVIAIADAMAIPIFNLQNPDAEQRLENLLSLKN